MTTVGYSMPVDMTIEILLKLPAESVLRFKSVSKSWCSIINSQQFVNAFMSLSRPRVVLAFNNCDDDGFMFFSSTYQSCSLSSSSSMIVAKKYTLTMPKDYDFTTYVINSVRGFVCCSIWNWYIVCNPTTGQVINLKNHHCDCMYLGYDQNSDKYKVLRLMSLKPHGLGIEYSVRTLGSSDSWRSINSSILYYSGFKNCACIDSVVYFKCINLQNSRNTVGIFYVGSELLRFVETPEDIDGRIENYLGKLAVYCSININNGFNLWVLDDVKSQVWSKKTYVFPISSKLRNFHFKGITVYGEIVYVQPRFSDPFELLCYDVDKKVERSVRLERFSDVNHSDDFYCFLLCSYVNNIIYL